LDIEAQVDSDDNLGDDDEDLDLQGSSLFLFYKLLIYILLVDNFINDEDEEPSRPHLWPGNQPPDDEDMEIEDILRDIRERSRVFNRSERTWSPLAATNEDDRKHEIARQHPDAEDYPLWRVGCRVCPFYQYKFILITP
jgi:hypothetical protein